MRIPVTTLFLSKGWIKMAKKKKTMGFAHLHVHDEYSLLDGYGSAKKYVQAAKDLGFEYLASTNHGTIDGLIKFQKACDDAGIKPILGCELYITRDINKRESGEKYGHATVLVKNEIGFQNLCKMLTKANLEGFYYKPRVGFADFLAYTEGLVVLTGCGMSFLTLNGGEDLFANLLTIKGSDLYLEVMPHPIEIQERINEICLDLSGKFGVPLVATNDCHYIEPDDWEIHEVLLCIQTKAKISDPDRFKFPCKGFHLRSEDEMISAFKKQGILRSVEIDEALDSTIEIAKKCSDFRIKKQDIFLPKVPEYADKKSDFLLDLAYERLEDYAGNDSKKYKLYEDRLLDEWELIEKKKFIDYFCIVHELIGWCRKNGIMTGPGRGSVGGSLLAFLIGITMVDPIKYDLLFSRFIAESRTDYPDIDIDFEDSKRGEVREHLEELYGKKNISSISTFLTMKGRAAVRDVARVYEIPLEETDEFAKAIENAAQAGHDEGIIQDAVNNTPEGEAFADKHPKVVEMAIKLEGQIRGAGQHAAAIVVSADDLTQGTRGYLVKRSGNIVSNWDMLDSEYVGLMKLDVLGLNTLSVLNEARRLIGSGNEKKMILFHPESDSYFVEDRGSIVDDEMMVCDEVLLDYSRIPLDDKRVYDELADGNTIGVFQLNTWAGKKLSKDIGTDNFYQIADNLALVRPGPFKSGMTDDYVARHWGEKWDKKHPLYEKITEKTYGLIVYQEQVMQVINQIAGLPYETADKIRKVIGKKRDAKEFAPYKKAFADGCKKEGYFDEDEVEWFWEMLQNHASYSLNLAHAVEYAMIAYWTAWVKTYFPAEFICASLTYGADVKKEELVDEAQRLGINIVLPRVGKSAANKWMVEGDTLYCPFTEIKGVGEKTAVQAAEIKVKSDAKLKGFFGVAKQGKNTKLENILKEIGAFGELPTTNNLDQYFSFDISGITSRGAVGYPKLYQLIGDREIDLKSLLSLDFKGVDRLHLIKKDSWCTKKLLTCKECTLSGECEYGPVLPAKGKFNVMIVGDAPGKDEDKKGKMFIEKDYDLLWDELDALDLHREDFHLTTLVKCYPKMTRTPGKSHIKTCNRWLMEEIEALDCKLILALGKTCLTGFLGMETGIKTKSGTTQWIESLGAWVCWNVNPSAVARHVVEREFFAEGLKNFADKIDLLGGL